LLAIFGVVSIWAAIQPHDYFTWFLEVWPAYAGLVVLGLTYRRFRFTNLVYALICAHAIVLLIGGHYTYAQVPLFDWIRDTFHQARNNYDRVAHFAQGFVPAMIAREFFLRRGIVKRGWIVYVVLSVCLAISALYELLEWQTALWTGSAANDFLGTQGDLWDTQKDMATCLLGAATALLALGRWHDRQIAALESKR
jgi:putative membrane protein